LKLLLKLLVPIFACQLAHADVQLTGKITNALAMKIADAMSLEYKQGWIGRMKLASMECWDHLATRNRNDDLILVCVITDVSGGLIDAFASLRETRGQSDYFNTHALRVRIREKTASAGLTQDEHQTLVRSVTPLLEDIQLVIVGHLH
jgi:hypothetical protein